MAVTRLPTEIIMEIYQQQNLEREDNFNMLLVCKQWERACTPLFFKELLVEYAADLKLSDLDDGTTANRSSFWFTRQGSTTHFWRYPEYANSQRYQYYIRKLTLEFFGSGGHYYKVDGFPTLRMMEILQNLSQVAELEWWHIDTGIGWVDFWKLFDTAMASMPNLSSMELRCTIDFKFTEPEQGQREVLRKSLANLKTLGLYLTVRIERADMPATIDAFFKRLFNTLGENTGNIITSLDFASTFSEGPKTIEPEAPRTWKLTNLEYLNYHGGKGNYRLTNLLSADFSKVKLLELPLDDLNIMLDKWDEAPLEPPVFENVEVITLEYAQPFENSEEWSRSLKYFPNVKEVKFRPSGKPYLTIVFPITRNENGAPVVGEPTHIVVPTIRNENGTPVSGEPIHIVSPITDIYNEDGTPVIGEPTQ